MIDKSSKKKERFDAKKEISELKREIKRIDTLMINQENFSQSKEGTIESEIESFQTNLDKKTQEAKEKITTYTMELVSLVVGLLAILMAIVVVGIDRIGLTKYTEPIVLYLGILFVVMFTIFVIYWIKVNYCEKQN